DAADAIAEGWTKEQITELIASAIPYEPPKRLRSYTLGSFLALDIKPRELVLSPWLPTQGLIMLDAPRGVGKTYVSLGSAYTIAAGGDFLKWKATRARRVLYVDGEMPARTMQERFGHFLRGCPLEPRPDMLRIITPDLQEGAIPDLATESGQD